MYFIVFYCIYSRNPRIWYPRPWGTYAKVGASLHDARLAPDCSHSVFHIFNSTRPEDFASKQWMQSVRMQPDGPFSPFS